MIHANGHQPIPAMSARTRRLIEKLRTIEKGQMIDYDDLTAHIGEDVRGDKARPSLYSAMRHLLHEGRVYSAVFGKGIKYLNDEELVAVGDQTMRRIKKLAARSARKLGCVEDFSRMPEAERNRHQAVLSLSLTIATVTSEKRLAKLQARVKQVGQALPLAQTLHAFLE